MSGARKVWVGRIARGLARSWRRSGPAPVAARPVPRLSRASYIVAPSPIEGELRSLFSTDAALTIFDVGSCEGEDSIRYGRLFPRCRIIACEPLPENVATMRRNLRRYAPNLAVTVVPVALADRNGRGTFHVSAGQPDDRPVSDWDYGNKSSSLLPPDRHLDVHPWVRFDRDIEVETETLEHLADRLGIDRIDFMHLDVQGAELAVLTGAGRLASRIMAIWMEVEAVPLYRGQPLKAEVEEFMTGRGYRKLKDTVGPVSGDQLWVRS